jgi:hypothetical protein
VVVGAMLDGIVLAILSQGIHSILWRARCSGICSSYVLQPPINRIAPRSMPGTGSEANDEVAMKALAKDPMRRHQTAREFARNL